jgi:hypothetical protein
MIAGLAVAAMASLIVMPALAIHHLSVPEIETGLRVAGAASTVSIVEHAGRACVEPFLSGLI